MKLLDILARIASSNSSGGRELSRRDFFAPSAVLAGMWSSVGQAARAGTGPNLRLIERLTFGVTEAEIARLTALGDHDYIEYQVDYELIDDSVLDQRMASYLALWVQPFEAYLIPWNRVLSELTEATILRSVLSERQLYQRMVEFWTDHFNVDFNQEICGWLKLIDDREVVRAHAMGTFRELLGASAHSPAMLFYLDNHVSRVGFVNENYGRELMELHTLGVNGGYTQQDVIELARCLTGWGLWGPHNGTNTWSFQWNVVAHDQNQKVLLGNIIPPNGGQNDGEMALDLLAGHPSTAQFLAKKLCKRFWGYNPPQSLIEAVAAAYTSSGGDIKAMLRVLFHSPEAAAMPLKHKRPYHLVVSALRAIGATISSTTALRQAHLAATGHVPFFWGPPDGYPDVPDYWAGLVLPRWNFANALVNNAISGITVDIESFLDGATTADAIMDRIDAALFGGAMNVDEKDKIRTYLLPDPPTETQKRDALGLAICSPGFQWY